MDRAVSRTLDAYVESLELPDWFDALVSMARTDLFYGPVYLNDEGEHVTCFDEGAKQFDFCGACDRIEEALSSVSDLWIDTQAEDWSEREPEAYEDDDGELFEPDWYDYYHVERSDIIAHIAGRELARHVS